MRLYSVLALMTSAFALAACGGGGGGFGGSVLGSGSVASGVGSMCPLTGVDTTPDPSCIVQPVDPTAIVDADGDGINDEDDDDTDNTPEDTDGSTGSGAGGNSTGLTTGNRSIFVAKNVYDKPTTGKAALSTLASDSTLTLSATTEAILSANKPKKLLFLTDTKSTRNGTLAVAETQPEYIEGTRDMRWVYLGHTTASLAAIAAAVNDKNGAPLEVDPNSGKLIYTADDPAGAFADGDEIDYNDDALWNQITPYMSAKANGGAGANYREYRLSNGVVNGENYRDEALQVWAWDDSYAMQYRNGATNGEPKHEIWSFGGRAATNVATGGVALFNGRYVGTAKTENWVAPTGAKIDPNALWMVQGRSTIVADFDTSKVTGTLTTETWTSEQDDNPLWTWYTNASGTPSTATGDEPNYGFYNRKVLIDANLVNDGTLTGQKNLIEGGAKIDGGFLTGDNSVLGGLFGTNGTEVTGVFHVNGKIPQPIGGSTGTTNGGAATLIMNGSFNGTCAETGAGTCVGTTP